MGTVDGIAGGMSPETENALHTNTFPNTLCYTSGASLLCVGHFATYAMPATLQLMYTPRVPDRY